MYKFKSANDRDVEALLNNQLWISTLEKMNDPMDLGFYINSSKHSDNDIRKFQDALNKSFVIISLASKVQNRRLWNYYTDGMKGFALDYRVEDLAKALKAMGAKTTISKKVTYGDEKLELSDMLDDYMTSGKVPTLRKADLLFKKDISWSSEDEHRIVTEADFLKLFSGAEEEGGLLLENVMPSQINVGYKMDSKKLSLLESYAQRNNIEVRQFIPNFRSRDSGKFKSTVIVGKNAGEEQEENIVDQVEPRQFFEVYDGEYEIS